LWKPEIDPAYYSESRDMETMIAGLRALIEIGKTGPLRRFLDRPFLPSRHDLSDSELAEHVRENTQTLYHPVGTCAIGSVVDAELRVQGVEGLRVVDASVMPVVPRGNTNAPTIMVAEKGADLIRGR
jgi:choline dehydrogenase